MRPIVQSRVAFTKHQRLYEDILTKQGSLTCGLVNYAARLFSKLHFSIKSTSYIIPYSMQTDFL